jgi:hypothetical protein
LKPYRKTLKAFQEALEQFTTNTNYGPRHSYCTLLRFHKGTPYRFEMRNFNRKDRVMYIASCNWELTAGPCTLTLDDKSCKQWYILELEPEMQVLYGN